MKVSLVWSSPHPERTIAAAMRRCYSTKPIEDIEAELEQKGPEYWKYLIGKALQDRSLDVFEHFVLTLAVEGMAEVDMGPLARTFPYLRATRLRASGWLLTLNGRTLVELWKDPRGKPIAETIVMELSQGGICPIFIELAFGVKVNAS
jgi:hypothetical protein